MLDALGQLTTSNAAESAISAASSPTADDSSGFSSFMDEIGTSTAMDTPPTRPDDSDRADVGQGWEAAEETDYEDPALAVAGAEQEGNAEPAADDSVGESVQQTDSEGGEATLTEQVGTQAGDGADTATTAAAMMEDLKAQSAQLTTTNASTTTDAATEAEGAVASNAQTDMDPITAVANGSAGAGDDASVEAQAMQSAMDAQQTDAKAAEQIATGESAESKPDGAMAGALEELEAQVQAEAQAAGAEMASEAGASAEETVQAAATVSMPGVETLDATAATAGEAIAATAIGQTDQAESPMAATTATANAMAEADAADDLPAPNVDQLASRTVRWRNVGLLGQGGSARIRLDPPSLGTVEVTLRTSGQSVQVEMTVESEAVRNLLQGNSDRLAQSLQAHGMQADRIEVTVQTPADAQTEGEGQDDAGQQQPRQQQDPDAQDDDFAEQMDEELNVTA